LVRDIPCAAVDDQGRFLGVRNVFWCPNNDNAMKKRKCEIGE
jgi:hypothetical protein